MIFWKTDFVLFLVQIVQKMANKCFRKCISSPGTELDSREQVPTRLLMPLSSLSFFNSIHCHLVLGCMAKRHSSVLMLCCILSVQKCLAMCMDRYMEAWNLTSRAYNRRLQKESQGGL